MNHDHKHKMQQKLILAIPAMPYWWYFFPFLLDYVAELFETLTTTPRGELDVIREELKELQPAALHSLLSEKEDKEAAKTKYNQRKARETVICPPTCSGINNYYVVFNVIKT